MNLDSSNLGKWTMNEVVSNTEQISNYTESTFMHLSGDSNIGTLSLSGNLNVGKDNEIIGKNSVAFGEECKTGLRCYEIVSADKTTRIITIKGKDIPSDVIGTKASLLTNGLPGIDFADVVSIEESGENTNIKVSAWHNKLDESATSQLFFFSAFPELGEEIVSNDALAVGINCKVLAKAGTAFGEDCVVNGARGHAEGYNAVAGWAAHAEGQNVIAGTVCSHCEGRSNSTNAYISHVEGFGNAISAENAAVGSHVAGIAAQSQHPYSFVWSGENRKDADGNYGNYGLNEYYPETRYSSHGTGTFNVNPLSGIDGFFIGESNLKDNIHLLLLDGVTTQNLSVLSNYIGNNGKIEENKIGQLPSGSIASDGIVRTSDSIAIGCKDGDMKTCAIADASLCCAAGKEARGNAFALGYNAKAYNYCATCFGSGEANGEYAFAVAGGTAHGTQAVAFGSGKANGSVSFAHGMNATANGPNSHAEGAGTITQGTSSHAEGSNTTSFGGSSHAEGYNTTANGEYSHSEGYNTSANEKNSHSEGLGNNANAENSHVEGINTNTYGKSSHAEGNYTTTGAKEYDESSEYKINSVVTFNNGVFICIKANSPSELNPPPSDKSSNEYWEFLYDANDSNLQSQHAEGCSTQAIGAFSHAEGYESKAVGIRSHSDGRGAIAKHERSYAWSGTWSSYESNGNGTFNINPEKGIDGFFVGDKCITEYFGTDSDLRTKIYSAISSVLNVDDPKDVEYETVTTALSNLALALKD